ncbi:MAG: Hsp33 family molecular chaperone HslO, partial [Oscillospiraceae bacterium]|nr:Hsp33 family molecular chaperone HslO [Oscillospiraceae bacterium]
MAVLIRNLSEDGGIIVNAIDSTDIVQKMEQLHRPSAVCTAALGRLLTAACLMSAQLKNKADSLTLRIKGDGPACGLLAKADGAGHVKGYLEEPLADLPPRADGKLNVGGVVGHTGTLTVIKDLGLKEPYV